MEKITNPNPAEGGAGEGVVHARAQTQAQAEAQIQPNIGEVHHQTARQRNHTLRHRPSAQEQQVDIRIGRHVATSVAAVWHQRNTLPQAIRAVLAEISKGGLINIQDDRIEQVGQVSTELNSGCPGGMPRPQLMASVGQTPFGRQNTFT